MKKIGVIAGALVLALGLCSCGAKPNANGWYDDFESAKKDYTPCFCEEKLFEI